MRATLVLSTAEIEARPDWIVLEFARLPDGWIVTLVLSESEIEAIPDGIVLRLGQFTPPVPDPVPVPEMCYPQPGAVIVIGPTDVVAHPLVAWGGIAGVSRYDVLLDDANYSGPEHGECWCIINDVSVGPHTVCVRALSGDAASEWSSEVAFSVQQADPLLCAIGEEAFTFSVSGATYRATVEREQ